MKKSTILFILVSLFLFFGWNSDPTINTPVCLVGGTQVRPQIAPDGSGGAVITWEDYRNGNDYDIFAQRVDSIGNTRWTAGGVAICSYFGEDWSPRITPDGSGGAIITWHGNRSGNYDIYAQRVDSGGNTLWTANGVGICTAAGDQQLPEITPDGSGGAIITWRDNRNNYDIYAQRVDSNGNALWTAGGVGICQAVSLQDYPMIVTDGNGGAIICWNDVRSGNYDIYAQGVDSGGNTLWTADGLPICTDTSTQLLPMLVSDGSGGAIITWDDYRNANGDIFAQRVDSGGNTLWTTDGAAICQVANTQESPKITPDGSGGAIIAWKDWRNGYEDIYAQRVDSGGNTLWMGDVAVLTNGLVQYSREIISNGSGGAIITWFDRRTGGSEIYAQGVDSEGNTLWATNGVTICSASGFQDWPKIVTDGSGGAIITWHDYRNGNADIYAQRVCPDGSLGDCMYFIHAAVSGGHGTVSPLNQSVPPGEDVFISITPNPGYRILSIRDNGHLMEITNPYVIYNVVRNHDVVVTFVSDEFPPTINLSAVRKTESAWIIKKDYGEITIAITEHPTNPLVVAKYILYRIESGIMVQLAEYLEAGSYTHIDKFLESDKSYSYQVVGVDAAGTVLAESEIVTI